MSLKFRAAVAVLVALLTEIFAAATALPAQAAQQAVDPSAVVAGLKGDFWLELLVALVAGALGGLVYELILLQGNLELPHKPTPREASLLGGDDGKEAGRYALGKHVFDLGVFARVIVGAAAAVAALWVVQPGDALALVATAVVAGSAGTAVFRSVQDRLQVSVALRNEAETARRAGQLAEKAAELKGAVAKLKGDVAASSLDGGESLNSNGSQSSPGPENFAEVERLSGEIEGIRKTIGGGARPMSSHPRGEAGPS